MRTVKEPVYPALLHFVSKENKSSEEYVVIATSGPISEHCKFGFAINEVIEIDDYGTMPTDRPLAAE